MPTLSFPNVTAVAKANVYFDGRVVSHTLLSPDGTRRTLGLIHPGSYHFNTEAPEAMDIVAGACTVKVDGSADERTYRTGDRFEVPGRSGFTIAVTGDICEYVCLFVA